MRVDCYNYKLVVKIALWHIYKSKEVYRTSLGYNGLNKQCFEFKLFNPIKIKT